MNLKENILFCWDMTLNELIAKHHDVDNVTFSTDDVAILDCLPQWFDGSYLGDCGPQNILLFIVSLIIYFTPLNFKIYHERLIIITKIKTWIQPFIYHLEKTKAFIQ